MVCHIVPAHTVCAYRDYARKLVFLKGGASKYEHIVARFNYSGKENLSNGYWNPKRRWRLTKHLEKIIKLQFAKNKKLYFVTCFKAFQNIA